MGTSATPGSIAVLRRLLPRFPVRFEARPKLFSLKRRNRALMIEPRPSVIRFVRAVVRAELARTDGARDSHAAQLVMVRLHKELEKLIGPAGFDVLFARSLLLAQRAHPVLAGITAGQDGMLAGLNDPARDGVALEEGATAIVSHFIELLVTLIGEDLVMRLLRNIWPGVEKEEEQ